MNRPHLLLMTLLVLWQCNTISQSLPMEMQISPDGRMLYTGGNSASGLYDSAIIRSVYLDFPQSNYWNLLLGNYASKTEIPASMTVDGVVYDSVGIRFKGNTSYTMTGNSQKKPFNISVDYVHDDQRIMGYKTLNFNNNQGDPSFLREIFYLHQIRRYVPAAKACFIHLYLNNADWGIYTHVQQLNRDFLGEWFLSNDGINWRADKPDSLQGPGPGGQWGDGTAALNYLGPDTMIYQQYYTLKSSKVDHPWEKLMVACSVLNMTPVAQLTTVLPAFFDIDRTLWFLAAENAFADDDSYIMKGKMDYYVYYEAETGRLMPVEYDGNSVLSSQAATWSPFKNETNVNYPLLNKLLAVPEWRQRYLAHLRTIVTESMTQAECGAIIDNYKTQIDALYQTDPKKMVSYSQMLTGVTNLKNVINNRRNYLLNHAEVNQSGPQISNVMRFNSNLQPWIDPAADDPVHITAQVTATNGVSQVYLYYSPGFTGNFDRIPMFDDGLHQDGLPGDGTYGATIPGLDAGVWVRFYIEAKANNAALTATYMPAGAEHNVFLYRVQPQALLVSGVVINELMADNDSYITDPAGEYDDWFELHNLNAFAVNIGGCFLSDKPATPNKWQIPAGTVIPALGYLIFWADENGSQGPTHTNFKLSASGEAIIFSDSALNVIDSVTFGPQQMDMSYARVPNGTGNWVIQAPTFNASNDLPAALPEIMPAESLRIYPNPASTSIIVQRIGSPGLEKLQVFNLQGMLIHDTELTESVELNCSSWSPGLYLFRIGAITEKVVIAAP